MWLLPSRGRPQLAARFFAAGVKTPGLLILDDDDVHLYEGLTIPENWRKVIFKRMWLGEKLNKAFNLYRDEPWYGMINDDFLPKTQDWDLKLVEASKDCEMVWANNVINKRIGCSVIRGELVRRYGWISLPGLKHFYIDDVHEIWAKEVNGKYHPEIVVSHEHFTAGRAVFDQTYRERPSPDEDHLVFEAWQYSRQV